LIAFPVDIKGDFRFESEFIMRRDPQRLDSAPGPWQNQFETFTPALQGVEFFSLAKSNGALLIASFAP
jgi:hypothetical protein